MSKSNNGLSSDQKLIIITASLTCLVVLGALTYRLLFLIPASNNTAIQPTLITESMIEFTITPVTMIPTDESTTVLSLPPISSASCVPGANEIVSATVTRIVDGDTIDVNINGVEYKLRYIGVDTPEVGSPGGSEATEYNRSLVEGKSVLLVKDVSDVDHFDRMLRYVFVDDLFVNFELVNNGYASSGSWPPDTSCDQTFANAYNSALANQLGLFASTITPEPIIEPTATNAIVSLCPNGCITQQPGCDIKGNISSNGEKIYHAPGERDYDKTEITKEGELWFCTTLEAEQNGWRAPYN